MLLARWLFARIVQTVLVPSEYCYFGMAKAIDPAAFPANTSNSSIPR